MKQIECEFEAEVIAASIQGRYPDRLDTQLSAHIAACPVCTDLAIAAGAVELMKDVTHDDARAAAAIPDSGRVWWLAQLRARREAAETAASPITAAQVIAFALGAGLVGACLGATSTWFQSALRWFASRPFGEVAALVSAHAALSAGVAALFFLVPVAVYLAMGRD
jgi:hypothetical protein